MTTVQTFRRIGNLVLIALVYLTVSGTMSVDPNIPLQAWTVVAPTIRQWNKIETDTSYVFANSTFKFRVEIQNNSYVMEIIPTGDCGCESEERRHFAQGIEIKADLYLISGTDTTKYPLSTTLGPDPLSSTNTFGAEFHAPPAGVYRLRVVASHCGLNNNVIETKTSEREAWLKTTSGTAPQVTPGLYDLVRVQANKGNDSLNIVPPDTSRNFLRLTGALACDLEEYVTPVPSWVGVSTLEIPRTHGFYHLYASVKGDLIFEFKKTQYSNLPSSIILSFNYLPVNSTSFKLHYVDAAHSVDYTNTYVRR